MPTSTTAPLLHGLGSGITFRGVFQLANGLVLLFDATHVWIMPDNLSAAVLYLTNPGTHGNYLKGAVGRTTDDNPCVVISYATDPQILFIDWTAGPGPTPSNQDVALTCVHPATGVSWNQNAAFLVIGGGAQGTVDYNQPQIVTPGNTGVTPSLGTDTDFISAAFQCYDVPGISADHPAWSTTPGNPDFELLDVGLFLSTTPPGDLVLFTDQEPSWDGTDPQFMPTFKAGSLTDTSWIGAGNLANNHCAYVTNDGSGVPIADMGGGTTAYTPSAAAWERINSLWLIALSGPSDTKLYAAAAGAADAPSLTHTIATVYNRGQFFSLDSVVGFNAIAGATYELFTATDGVTWSSIRTGANHILGAITGGGAGAGTLLELDTTAGTLMYSTDRGVTWSGPTAAVIDPALAATIARIHEGPLGLIATDETNCHVYTCPTAHLTDGTLWTDTGFTGYSNADLLFRQIQGIRSTDDGTLFLQELVVDTGALQRLYTWRKLPAGDWEIPLRYPHTAINSWNIVQAVRGGGLNGKIAIVEYGGTHRRILVNATSTGMLKYDLSVGPVGCSTTPGQYVVVGTPTAWYRGDPAIGTTGANFELLGFFAPWEPGFDRPMDHTGSSQNFDTLITDGSTMLALSSGAQEICVTGDGSHWFNIGLIPNATDGAGAIS